MKFEETFRKDTKIYKVFLVLKDKQWQCRECKYRHIGITQIAGGSGIQGLQRGLSGRKGMEIDSGNHLCTECTKKTRHDKWTGNFCTPVATSSAMPKKFQERVLNLLKKIDVVEGTKRPSNQLVIDHKLPTIRWSEKTGKEQENYQKMTDADIRNKFQLLKKSNGSVSHNLLKSRSCEQCFSNKKRGKPFGIYFYYKGNENWLPTDSRDSSGCIGCGWYDFDLWRKHLNKILKIQKTKVAT